MGTERIDVLVAMRRALDVINDDITDADQVADVFEQLREARAAAAELIEAADNAASVLRNVIAAGQIGTGYQSNLDDLRAALARVGGAQ